MLDPLELPVGTQLVARRQDGELIAAKTERLRVVDRGEQLADQYQHVVADRVPVDVVDMLEVVDIDEAERERLPAA